MDAISEDCPHCGASEDFVVFVEQDVLTRVTVNKGEYDFSKADELFEVLKEDAEIAGC